jgi:hypothetical protein
MAVLTGPVFIAPLGGLYRILTGTYSLLTSVTDVVTGFSTIIFAAALPKSATQAAGEVAYATVNWSAGTLALYGWDDAGAANTVATTVQALVIGY